MSSVDPALDELYRQIMGGLDLESTPDLNLGPNLTTNAADDAQRSPRPVPERKRTEDSDKVGDIVDSYSQRPDASHGRAVPTSRSGMPSLATDTLPKLTNPRCFRRQLLLVRSAAKRILV